MDKFPDIGPPDWNFTESTDEDIVTVSLGDGYIVRVPNGINYQKGSWSPRWSHLDEDVAEAAYEWIRVRKNLVTFEWDHPKQGLKRVVCTASNLTYDTYNNSVLSLSFKEDFNP